MDNQLPNKPALTDSQWLAIEKLTSLSCVILVKETRYWPETLEGFVSGECLLPFENIPCELYYHDLDCDGFNTVINSNNLKEGSIHYVRAELFNFSDQILTLFKFATICIF